MPLNVFKKTAEKYVTMAQVCYFLDQQKNFYTTLLEQQLQSLCLVHRCFLKVLKTDALSNQALSLEMTPKKFDD